MLSRKIYSYNHKEKEFKMVQSKAIKNNLEIAEIELENARKAHQRYLIKQQNSDWNNAIEGYMAATEHNPNLPEAYYRLAFLMWEKGEIDVAAAINQCKTALKFSPESPNAHTYSAFFMKIAQEYVQAEEEFKKAIKLSGFKSARPRLLFSLSTLKKMNVHKPTFVDSFKSLYYFVTGSLMFLYDIPSLKMLHKSFNDDLIVFSYKSMGTFLERLKIFPLAINLYEKATKKTGHEEIFYLKMGDVSLRSKNIETALVCYQKALTANPKNKKILMKLASVTQTYFPDLVDDSIDYYTMLLDVGLDDSGFVYYELGHLYLKKNDKINAISAFSLALDKDKTNPFYHNSLAFAYLKAELFEDAIIHYNMAISINPDNEWTAIVCHVLGSTYTEIYGDLDSAITKFKEGIALDPKNYDLRLALGDSLIAFGDIDNAIRTYCDAIELDSENYRGYSKAALALWEKDFIEEALVSYHKALDLNPEYDIANNNLGVIYLDSLGCAKDALGYFEKAIEANPQYTMAYLNAGRACQLMNEKTIAAEYYQMALDLNKITEELNEAEIKEKLHSLFEA